MISKYQKVRYNNFGYYLTHTTGVSAEQSTLGYPHSTNCCMLYYFMHGCGNIKVEGRRYEIQPGDIILLNPSELFCCSIDEDNFHERIVLHLENNLTDHLPHECGFLFSSFYDREKGVGNRIPAETVVECGLNTTLELLLKLSQDATPENTVLAFCKVVETLTQLHQVITQIPVEATQAVEPQNELIERVLIFVNNNFTKAITVASVADKFFINKSYLSHLFKDCVGMSLWTYVILRRLHTFNELVQNGKTVEDASRQVGFQNYSNFFRLYKKYMDMTPSEYKKQCKSN